MEQIQCWKESTALKGVNWWPGVLRCGFPKIFYLSLKSDRRLLTTKMIPLEQDRWFD